MTRRDQTIRSWISRTKPGTAWFSNVSLRGKLSKRSTGSMLRRAALEYNLLHVRELLPPPSSAILPPDPAQTNFAF